MGKPIITYQRAIELNLPRYYTGKPCKNGHYAERLTATSECVECKPMMDALRDEEEKDVSKSGPKTNLQRSQQELKRLFEKRSRRKLTKKEHNRFWYLRYRDKALAREAAKRAKAKETINDGTVNPQAIKSG